MSDALPYAVAVGFFLVTLYVLWTRTRVPRPGMEHVLGALEELTAHLGTTSEQPEPSNHDLLERLEVLERRMERVHKDCQNYLRAGKTALQRAERANADEDEYEDEDEDEADLFQRSAVATGAASPEPDAQPTAGTPVVSPNGRLLWRGLPPHLAG